VRKRGCSRDEGSDGTCGGHTHFGSELARGFNLVERDGDGAISPWSGAGEWASVGAWLS